MSFISKAITFLVLLLVLVGSLSPADGKKLHTSGEKFYLGFLFILKIEFFKGMWHCLVKKLYVAYYIWWEVISFYFFNDVGNFWLYILEWVALGIVTD